MQQRHRIWSYPSPAFLSIATRDARISEATREVLGLGTAHFLNQVHGTELVVFSENLKGIGAKWGREKQVGDGWLWKEDMRALGFALGSPDVPLGFGPTGKVINEFTSLGIVTADCVPAFLLEVGSGAGALLHLGRRGIEGGLLFKAVGELRKGEALHTRQFRLTLGPSIGPCCYEVPLVMAREFCRRAGCSAACVLGGRLHAGYCFLDLRRAIAEQAERCGVILEGVSLDCTSCDAQKYIAEPETQAPCYSYRQGHKTERIFSFVRFGIL